MEPIKELIDSTKQSMFSSIKESMRSVFSKSVKGLFPESIKSSFKEPFKMIFDITNLISEISKILADEFNETFPEKWRKKLFKKLKKVKKLYSVKIIKEFYIFKSNLFKYRKINTKKLIVFGNFVLYISSIFENYSKRIIKIFKNQPEELQHKIRHKVYRKEFKDNISEFYELVELNFAKFYGYLFGIADDLKHSDWKFYKRFENYDSRELLIEANNLYLELKLYIKQTLVAFSILQVRLYYPETIY